MTRQPATMMMGRPTQRRHSSTSTTMPTMPSATCKGSMRAPMSRISVQFTAKYMNAPNPASASTTSYHGMWLTRCSFFREGYIM